MVLVLVFSLLVLLLALLLLLLQIHEFVVEGYTPVLLPMGLRAVSAELGTEPVGIQGLVTSLGLEYKWVLYQFIPAVTLGTVFLRGTLALDTVTHRRTLTPQGLVRQLRTAAALLRIAKVEFYALVLLSFFEHTEAQQLLEVLVALVGEGMVDHSLLPRDL